MRNWRQVIAALALGLALGFVGLEVTAQGKKARPRILYLTLSKGFEHKVLPESEKVMRELGEKTGAFEVTATKDSSLISAEGLKNYDIIMFYTTGDLGLADDQKKALLDFVKSGKGFIGVHSATDTYYNWPEYGELIGGYFDGHPWNEEVGVKVEDTGHPSTKHLSRSFRIADEIYQYKGFSRDRVKVLMSLDTAATDMTKKGIKRTDGDFALAWYREYGRGRVYYNALGHRPEVWNDERFQKMLLGAVEWITRAPGEDAKKRGAKSTK